MRWGRFALSFAWLSSAMAVRISEDSSQKVVRLLSSAEAVWYKNESSFLDKVWKRNVSRDYGTQGKLIDTLFNAASSSQKVVRLSRRGQGHLYVYKVWKHRLLDENSWSARFELGGYDIEGTNLRKAKTIIGNGKVHECMSNTCNGGQTCDDSTFVKCACEGLQDLGVTFGIRSLAAPSRPSTTRRVADKWDITEYGPYEIFVSQDTKMCEVRQKPTTFKTCLWVQKLRSGNQCMVRFFDLPDAGKHRDEACDCGAGAVDAVFDEDHNFMMPFLMSETDIFTAEEQAGDFGDLVIEDKGHIFDQAKKVHVWEFQLVWNSQTWRNGCSD